MEMNVRGRGVCYSQAALYRPSESALEHGEESRARKIVGHRDERLPRHR